MGGIVYLNMDFGELLSTIVNIKHRCSGDEQQQHGIILRLEGED